MAKHANEGSLTRFKNLIGRTVKKIDKFGHPITFTYDNEPAFKTVFGGIMTILTYTSILVYLGINISTVWNQSSY